MQTSRLIDLLVAKSIITQDQAMHVAMQAKINNSSIFTVICDIANFNNYDFYLAISNILQLEFTTLDNYSYPSSCLSFGLKELITAHKALPIKITPTCTSNIGLGYSLNQNTLTLAIFDPTNLQMIKDDFRFATGCYIKFAIAPKKILHDQISKLYSTNLTSTNVNNITDLQLEHDELATSSQFIHDNSPISRYIYDILLSAIDKQASDIHFEPYINYYRVRMRCDGVLIEHANPPYQFSRRLATRIKVLAHLDITNRRTPQDGQIQFSTGSDLNIDIRVASIPTAHGEKIVLRILNKNAISLNFKDLGFSDKQQKHYKNALLRSQGLILITGATGSGKTMSLYAGINFLNSNKININTAEDPIEIYLAGVNQVQLQTEIGLDFPTILRAFLRQDPDVIMVGEIRDNITAEITVKAAQTGHLVLSSLHTNSATKAIMRLNNLGISNFDLALSLNLIIAQKLVRKLCNNCKIIDHLNLQLQTLQIKDSTSIYKANDKGCGQCNNGYLGRIGIYEMLVINEHISNAILANVDALELEKIAIAQGMKTLRSSALELLTNGATSLAEIKRIIN